MARPKRLVGISYTGCAQYFITSCTWKRRKVFLDHDFAQKCVQSLSAISAEFGYEQIAYCFMPDHVHFLTEGDGQSKPLPAFIARWKRETGWMWHQEAGSPLWQPGYWERILRENDPILSIARYIVENPVRSKLVKEIPEYPLTGSDRYPISEIMEAYQMDLKSGWYRNSFDFSK